MSRLSALATSPLLTQFAVTASQQAIRPVGNFIAPLCEVPDLTFRYKVYTEQNRYKVPITTRQPGQKATVLGFSATDATAELEPNALDFPIPNADNLSEEALRYSIMEAQSTLADAAALSLENEIITTAKTAAAASSLATTLKASDDGVDVGSFLDDITVSVLKKAKNGAAVNILFGAGAMLKVRNNASIKKRFVVSNRGGGGNVGTVAPTIADIGGLLMLNPQCQVSMMVIDTAKEGVSDAISFLLDNYIIVFASNPTPNRMDPSFMKTFARMGGFFRTGSYTTEDQRDQVLKMDWTTLPKVTNSAAVAGITVS